MKNVNTHTRFFNCLLVLKKLLLIFQREGLMVRHANLAYVLESSSIP